MVYSGKRSASCTECRTRKTKCDLRTPACGQCIRVRRTCSGPPDPTDLIFVHQTRKTVARPRVQKQRRTQGLPCTDAGASHPGHQLQQAGPQHRALNPSSCVLRFSVDDLGVNWFLHNRGNSSAFALQDHTFSIYHRQIENADVAQSMTAVGLAGYVKDTQQYGLVQFAERGYAKAVRVINQALSEPGIALQDRLLFSIMMLGMFEMNTWPHASGLQNLHNHANGLISLCHLFVRQGVLTQQTRRLMGLSVQFYAFQAWYFHWPLPDEYFIVKDESLLDTHHFIVRQMELVLEVTKFEARIRKNALRGHSLYTECSRIEATLHQFVQGLPSSAAWIENTVPEAFHHSAFQGKLHQYHATNAAHQRNILRYTQIHLNLILADQCRQILEGNPSKPQISSLIAQMEAANATVKRLAREICFSVPQLADYLDRLPLEPDQSKEVFVTGLRQATTALVELAPFLLYTPGPFKKARMPTGEEGLRVPKLESMYHIYWHLLFLPKIRGLGLDMQAWIGGRLRWIEAHADPEAINTLHMMKRRMERDVNIGLYCVDTGHAPESTRELEAAIVVRTKKDTY